MKWACLVLACLMVSSILLVNIEHTQATEVSAENTWQTLQPLSYPLSGTAVAVGQKIYLFYCNNYTNHLFVYDTQTQTLNETASMPTYRTRFGLAVVGHKIYTIGGQHSYPLPNSCTGGYPTSVTEVYDTQTGTWETKQSTIDYSDEVIANTVNDKIYAMYSGGRYNGSTIIDTGSNMDMYDPETDNWTRLPALPQELSNLRYSCAIDDAIYIIRDSTGDHIYDETIGKGKLYIYNATTGNWSTGATLPTFYKDCRVVATTGEHAPKQIYLVGGAIPHGFLDYHGVNASFRYDLTADCWNKTADMSTAHSYGAVAVADDKIYAIGGKIERIDWVDNPTSAVEVYTPFGYGTVQPSASPTAWFVFPDVTAVIVGVAIGAAVAGAVIAATVKIIKHQRHPKNAKQSQSFL